MKRITLFLGHYGSGKTNVAVNYALHLKESGFPVVIADLDIVNPYFRTKDSQKILDEKGIKLISSEYAASNVDFPAIPGEMYSVFDDKATYAVLDIGGDDRGAYALGRYRDQILEEDNYDAFLVINKYRPLTKTPELCVEIKEEIEAAAGIKLTGIVNNSNLGDSTTKQDVLDSYSYVKEVSEKTNLPIVFTTVKKGIKIDNTFTIELQPKTFGEVY
ncbi:MAG: hypothetical protein GX241_04975 [Ruminococcaceae bacterium]|nr:hypothetical protein [Oscillospiraceae bacterium]